MFGAVHDWRSPREVGERALIIGFVLASFRLRGQDDRSYGHLITSARTAVLPSDEHLLTSGAWSESLQQDLLWQVECLTTLLWAGGLLDALPAVDEMADPAPVIERINGIARDPERWLETVHLRTGQELHDVYERLYFWLWRARSGPKKGTRILPPAVAGAVKDALRDGRVGPRESAEGDVVACGKPFFRLDEDQQQEVHDIVFERSRAIRWLSRDFDDWWEPTLDTVVM